MRFDLHIHTRRHSSCSSIDPAALIPAALRAGLDGIVITEHEYQWSEAEIEALRSQSPIPVFPVLSGFEYRTVRGDLLVYGLQEDAYKDFTPGMTPQEASAKVTALGGVCIAAHPTREGLDFDLAIADTQLAAIEVCSVNLRNHERRLAINLSNALHIPYVAASDAHALADVGRYASEFEPPMSTMTELQNALRNGKFRVPDIVAAELGIS